MDDVVHHEEGPHAPAFLTLGPTESEMLRDHAPLLAKRAPLLAERFYGWLQKEPILAEYLRGYDIARLTQQQAHHYRQLLLTPYDGTRRDALYQLGQLHHRVGLPIQWMAAVYTLYLEHSDDEVKTLGLEPEKASLLSQALRKRVQLDAFWQHEGVQAAEREAIAIRESFYRAVTEANRLFIEAARTDEIRVEETLSRLTNILVREMRSPFVWVGLVSPPDTRVDFLAAGGEAAEVTAKASVSIDPAIPEGNGPTGLAIRSGKVQIVRDTGHDPCLAPWRALVASHGLGGQGAAPFALKNGQRGVIAFYCRAGEHFPPNLEDLLARLAEDLGSFLDRCEETRELFRMRRYKVALDAMQFQLLQAPHPAVVYKLLVDLLLKHTDVSRAIVATREGRSKRLRVAAAAARDKITTEQLRRLRISIDPKEKPYGQMFTSRVYRKGAPIVLPHPREDSELRQAWQSDALHERMQAIAGWPVVRTGETTPDAVLVVQGTTPDYFTSALCGLLEQLAANVSIALTQHVNRQHIERLSLRDSLTNLPNRTYFEHTCEDAMALAHREERRVALGILDLDRFKEWNDTLGHTCGDYLLRKVAKVLRSAARKGECVARLGGDEFAFHFPLESNDDFDCLSQRLLNAVAGIEHEGGHITGSLGWAVYPDDGLEFSTLLSHADAALYGAKDAGRNTYKLYSGEIATEVQQRFTLRKTFPQAIKAGDLTFFLQPQADVVAGKLEGAELLVRWKSSQGWISPAQFLPTIERDRELLRLLGRHALREAVSVRQRLSDAGFALQIAVNIGPSHFLHPHFMDDVEECLHATTAKGLTIEITETAALEDLDRAVKVMASLRERGFKLSLDDFGTGYASLRYAARLPVDELKLDQHFIRRFRANPRSLAVVGASVLLGEMTDRSIIAEGIETAEGNELWMRVGGRRIQGYFLSRPLPQTDFLEWAAAWSAATIRSVTVFPIEDLPLLGQIFRDTTNDADLSGNSPYEECSLTRWFAKRVKAYGHLPAWQAARRIHAQYHAHADTRNAVTASDVLRDHRAWLRKALRDLYGQIDAFLEVR